MRLALAVLAVLAACKPFDPTYPSGIPCGPGGECPPGQSCAANDRCFSTIDAGTGVCPLALEQRLELVADEFVSGTLSGPSRYQLACVTNPAGSQAFWFVDVPELSGDADLVVDVEDLVADVGIDDAAIDISSDCTPETSLRCTDDTVAGAGEVAVFPNVTPGRKYITIATGTKPRTDSQGIYRVRAFLRPVLGEGDACDFHVEENRCGAGLFCIDGGSGAECTAIVPIDEGTNNDDCPGTTTVVNGDAVITGMTSTSEPDYIEVAPGADVNLRAIVYRGEDGGCPQDILVIRLDGPACEQSDQGDDNGLGGCGFIEDPVPFDHLQKHYLLVRGAGMSVTTPVPYTLVINVGYLQ
jgi:hypothetical protein